MLSAGMGSTQNTSMAAPAIRSTSTMRSSALDIDRQRMMGYENQSRYLAYHLFLSALDMAHLGN